MKICKNCQVAVEEEQTTCLNCGASLAEETEEMPVTEETPVAEEVIETAEAPKKKSRTGLIVGLAAAAVALVAAIFAVGSKNDAPKQEAPSGSVTSGYHINAHGLESNSIYFSAAADGAMTYAYMDENGQTLSVSPEDVAAMMKQTVAVCGDMELTNEVLAYYYQQSYYNVYSLYGEYLAYFMDATLSHDEQMNLDGTQTWERFLLESAIDQFNQVAALHQEAEAAGITLSQEDLDYLNSNVEQFDTIATANGLADAQALMEAQFGPGTSVESYVTFMEEVMLANAFAAEMLEGIEVTDEEVEAYYDANADMMLGSYGVEKIDKNMVNVRHILIQPTADADGTVSDEAWAAAEAEAQRIYDEWLAGGATEELFAEFANTYSSDGGSNTNGGLYEDVIPNRMVPAFNDWCFADGRQQGDVGIVKVEATNYCGYHIIYFSSECETSYWRLAASDLCRQEKAAAERDALTATYAPTIDLTKAVRLSPIAPTVPVVEEAPAAEETPAE